MSAEIWRAFSIIRVGAINLFPIINEVAGSLFLIHPKFFRECLIQQLKTISKTLIMESRYHHSLISCFWNMFWGSLANDHRQLWSERDVTESSDNHIYVRACSVAQSCLILCNLMDCSPPGSSVWGISQARVLEWEVLSYPRGSSWPRDHIHNLP